MKIIGLIPIRGGSKRFKDKNIYPVGGIPLFFHAATVAAQSRVFDRLIVSSDSERYLDIASNYDLEVHQRSRAASTDMASSEAVMEEVIRTERLEESDWLFLIQGTCPLQRVEYFRHAHKLILEGNVNSVVTYKNFKRFFLEDVLNKQRPRSQDLIPRRLETGLFWAVNVGAFATIKQRIIEPYGCVEVSGDDDADIDTLADLELVKSKIIDRLKERTLNDDRLF
jgi:CMP-N-acetylneuraminic acid synthetase